MKNEMFVSLWMGNTESEENLKDYVSLVYTDNGEYLSSIFVKEFRINPDEIDEDYLECAYYEQKFNTISTLLRGCSYEDEVVNEFKSRFGDNLNYMYNAVVLVYDYQYKKRKMLISNNSKFKYIGCVKIEYNS